jgi:hypothetical protein
MDKIFFPTWDAIGIVALSALVAGAVFGSVMALIKVTREIKDRGDE